MYAQQNSESHEKMQSFRRGEYSIPANYRGNAFTLDEAPCTDEAHDDVVTCQQENEPLQLAPPKELSEAQCADGCIDKPQRQSGGLLSDLLSHFRRGFELDDILLIGLIVLLLQSDCENRDETVVLLALLLLLGF